MALHVPEASSHTGVAPLQYCYITAKFVFLEALRADKRAPFHRLLPVTNPSNLSGQSATLLEADAGSDHKEEIADCLQCCLEKLSGEERELIVEYYRGQQRSKIERRAALATRLHVTANALSIRACRVRQRLEVCIQACLKKGEA